MNRNNYDKPFYVDVGASIVAIRCASNHDVIVRYDHARNPYTLKFAEDICDRMNREVEIERTRRNCDVGTAEEQYVRFREYCFSKRCESLITKTTLGSEVAFAWAQMPYDEGGAK